MKHKLFAIHDSAARAYLPPFALHQVGMAIRTFQQCLNSDTHQFGQAPGDYTLYEIGIYDDDNASIDAFETNISHGNGLQFVDEPTPSNGKDANP